MTKERRLELVEAIKASTSKMPWCFDEPRVDERFGHIDIVCEISWGDWKHDHLAVNHMVSNLLDEMGLVHFHSEICLEEDGSDAYSARHVWRVMA